MKNKKQPNILMITCDQLRHDFIGPSGNSFIITPNIDMLASEGCVYNNAYSPNPVCISARHNMITGLPARHHGFDDNYFRAEAKPAPLKLPTFAQILNDKGYETIAIGKMHFQPPRRATGFDFFYNMEEVPNSREEDDYAVYLDNQGYGNVQSLHGVRSCLYMQPQRSLLPEKHHGSTWVADHAIEFLKSNHGRKPFLMWTSFIQPHPPFNVPHSWADMYSGKIPPPVKSETPLSLLATENQQLACMHDDDVLTRMRELYASAVSFVDYNIGRILTALERNKMAENTLVIFTSDHGEMLGDLGTYQKFLPYDASCKIPFIIKYKDRVEPGSVDSRFVDLNDILPTFLDAAGLDYPDDYDLPGESVFVKNGVKNRDLQYVEHQRESKRWCSIRDKRYKYVFYYGDDEQLFDLKNDPNETTNLLYGAVDYKNLAIRNKLRESLISYESRYGLKGYIENGNFKKYPTYTINPYYETNFPFFTDMMTSKEKKKLNNYDDEILEAIKDEPTVDLRLNNSREILTSASWYSDKRFDQLISHWDKSKE